MNRKVLFRFMLWLTLSASAIAAVSYNMPKPDASGWCCLCMCGSKAQDKCSLYCIRRQNSKKIVEEPEMKKCTTECTMKWRKHE